LGLKSEEKRTKGEACKRQRKVGERRDDFQSAVNKTGGTGVPVHIEPWGEHDSGRGGNEKNSATEKKDLNIDKAAKMFKLNLDSGEVAATGR